MIKPNIVLHTCPNPEDNAMLQALYSRSSKSVTEHLEKLAKTGSGKFMEQFYIGYGHNSIADCGFVTMYLEGISMLAAKAIEDNPLYNGQECSSRYIDFSVQRFYNPYSGTKFGEAAEALLTAYREFYVTQLPLVQAHLTKNIPIEEGQDETTYGKAILAKTFDILRGFLPAGATTNVSVTISLRKAREHLELLYGHPLKEISDLAEDTYAKLREAHPNSFPPLTDTVNASHSCRAYNQEHENFYSTCLDPYDADFSIREGAEDDFEAAMFGSPLMDVATSMGTYHARPKRCTPHKHDMFYRGNFMHVKGILDFGSFRDLQRHRGGYCGLPVVDNTEGFNEWYYDMLPEESQDAADILFEKIAEFLELVILPCPIEEPEEEELQAYYFTKLKNQYLLPMGTNVVVDLVYSMAQVVYVTELRTGQTVHPTLRAFAQKMVEALEDSASYTKLYVDMGEDKFSIKRGVQDITEVKPIE